MARRVRSCAGSGREGQGAAASLLGLLGGALAGYLGLLCLVKFFAPSPSWPRMLLPSAWLLLACLWLLSPKKRQPHGRGLPLALFCGGRRRAPMAILAVLALAAVVAFAALWPRGGGNRAPGVVEALALVLLVPPAEEIYFRGLLLHALSAAAGRVLGAGLVSALFGLLHLPQGLAVVMIVLSLLLCLVTFASRVVGWAVVLHTAWNTMAVARLTAAGTRRWLLALTGVAAMLGWAALGLLRDDGTDRPTVVS